MQPKQAKITQKLLLRSALGLFALAGLVLAFVWYKGRESDPTGGVAIASAGWIAAIEATGDTSHAIVFKDDGTKIDQPNVPTTSNDEDVTWRPDGNALFFASDREKQKFTMYRWAPSSGSAEMRSPEGLVQNSPFFMRSDADLGGNAIGLVCAGGRVFAYDPKTPALRQVLPPPDPKARVSSDPNGGSSSQFEGVYERFGSSFRVAKWMPDRKAVVAVMRRETGEILIYQKLEFANPQEGQPRAIVAGDRVDFDIDQHSGAVCFSVQNFQWPDPQTPPEEFVKNGKATVPYRHGVAIVDVSAKSPMLLIARSSDDKNCFGEVTFDPAGDKLAFLHGSYSGSGNMLPDAIFLAGSDNKAWHPLGKLVEGEVYEPNWSPDGTKVAFARRETPETRAIYVADLGSPTPRRISPQTGIFSFPVFSPQAPK